MASLREGVPADGLEIAETGDWRAGVETLFDLLKALALGECPAGLSRVLGVLGVGVVVLERVGVETLSASAAFPMPGDPRLEGSTLFVTPDLAEGDGLFGVGILLTTWILGLGDCLFGVSKLLV